MKSSLRQAVLVAVFIFGICLEHVISLPLFSFTFAVFLFGSLPLRWRNVVFLVGSFVLAVVFFVPFWLSCLLFFILRAPIEFLSLPKKYEDMALVGSILLTTLSVGIWSNYPLHTSNLIWILLNIFVFSVIMMYFLRQRRPQQRTRAQYA